jgi:hypothetical protein
MGKNKVHLKWKKKVRVHRNRTAVVLKHMKRCSISIVIKEMQIKTDSIPFFTHQIGKIPTI